MAFMDFLSRIGVILGVYPEEAPADDRAPDYDEEYAAEDYYAPQANIREEPAASQARGGMGAKRSAAQSGYEPEEDPGYSTRRAAPNNVVQMPTRSESDPRRHSEMIVCVRRVEDSQNIINSLIEGRSVMLNLEEIDDTQRQRVIDMLGGAAFALRGKMLRVSHRTYLLAPSTVDVVNSIEMRPNVASTGEFNPAYRM